MSKPMIDIRHLVKKYGSNYAVNDVTFHVNEGEVVGFLGPNGAGKTTTMNILTGCLSATGGSASVAGIDMLDNPMLAKTHIGYLPEHPPLYPDMTVKEYLRFVYDLKRCTLNRKRHLDEICAVIRIEDVYDRPIAHLSKGYRQRVGIAQALVGNPDVLIFDEPTVGLDPMQIVEIRSLISGLGKKHTIILSSHILPEVQSVCGRVVIINKGKLVADEKTDNLSVLTGERKMVAKITGDASRVRNMLEHIAGVRRVDLLEERDADAHAFLIESETDVDVRKSLFTAVANAGLFLVGLEGVGADLEDVFISLLDKSEAKEAGNA